MIVQKIQKIIVRVSMASKNDSFIQYSFFFQYSEREKNSFVKESVFVKKNEKIMKIKRS